jgi:hypothetical protein
MIRITSVGVVTEKELDHVPDYKELNDALDGGHIEVIPRFNRFRGELCYAFCDEEGKLKGLPFNATATKLWERCWEYAGTLDHLVGPIVIIVGSPDFLSKL